MLSQTGACMQRNSPPAGALCRGLVCTTVYNHPVRNRLDYIVLSASSYVVQESITANVLWKF